MYACVHVCVHVCLCVICADVPFSGGAILLQAALKHVRYCLCYCSLLPMLLFVVAYVIVRYYLGYCSLLPMLLFVTAYVSASAVFGIRRVCVCECLVSYKGVEEGPKEPWLSVLRTPLRTQYVMS